MQTKKTGSILDIVPIFSPRTTYNQIKNNNEKIIADLTLNFDKVSIALLKKQFEKKNDELKLDEFIIEAKKHLMFWQPNLPNRQTEIVKYLTQLFNEIDINGNGDMEWKEFTNFIIQKATVLKNLKTKSDEIKRFVKSEIEPKIKIDGLIHKAEYIKDINKIAFFEESSGKIHFMDISDGSILNKTLEVDSKKLIISISSIKRNKDFKKIQTRKKNFQIPTSVRVLDMLYLSENKYRTLLVSTSDGYVRGWKYNQNNGFAVTCQPDNEEQLFQHFFNSEIYSLAWDNLNQVLYCGQRCGSIYIWNLKTDLEKILFQCEPENDEKNQIKNMITSMLTMPKLQFMACGRMDGKLILWDTINNCRKCTYKEHTRGILSLAFNESMILLFSGGFDHKICVWNPYISTLIHRIETHLAPILTLNVIQNSNQLISMDSDGTVKVIDTKRFHGLYSFNVQKNGQVGNQQSSSHQNQAQHQHLVASPAHTSINSNTSSFVSFISINDPLKLIFVGKSISVYEYDKNYNPKNADQNVTVACKYIRDTLSFMTASGNKIKVWSALNGDISKIFIDLTPNQITSLSLDTLKRRFIIGDSAGNISVHNALNGAKMKHLSKHLTEIIHIVTFKGGDSQTLVSCSIDNEIRIFKETNDDNYQIVRYIHFRQDVQITALEFQRHTKLFMVGTNVGTVGFYDYQTGKNVGNCLNKDIDEISSICATDQSLLIVTTVTGRVNIFAIPPLNTKFQKLSSFGHLDCEKKIKKDIFDIERELALEVMHQSGQKQLQGTTTNHYTSCEGNHSNLLGIAASCYNAKMNHLYVVDDKMYLTSYDFSPLADRYRSLKAAKNSQSVNTFHGHLLTFPINWQVKTNHQIVKFSQYIEQQNIICTSSYDKKVKFWNADTGQLIDSLQQNYNKSQPSPIAYYDLKNHVLYNKDKKKFVKSNSEVPKVKQNFENSRNAQTDLQNVYHTRDQEFEIFQENQQAQKRQSQQMGHKSIQFQQAEPESSWQPLFQYTPQQYDSEHLMTTVIGRFDELRHMRSNKEWNLKVKNLINNVAFGGRQIYQTAEQASKESDSIFENNSINQSVKDIIGRLGQQMQKQLFQNSCKEGSTENLRSDQSELHKKRQSFRQFCKVIKKKQSQMERNEGNFPVQVPKNEGIQLERAQTSNFLNRKKGFASMYCLSKVRANLNRYKDDIGVIQKEMLIHQDISNYQKGRNALNRSNNNSKLQNQLTQQHQLQSQIDSNADKQKPSLTSTGNNQKFCNRQKQKSTVKRSMLKCINNCRNSQSQTIGCSIKNKSPKQMQKQKEKDSDGEKIKRKVNKSSDFTPIYDVLGFNQKKNSSVNHKKIFETLHKADTMSLINARQRQNVYLNKDQATAAKKLCRALIETDDSDKRPRNMLKSIKIKQKTSQSLYQHSRPSTTMNSGGLPRII